jgi:hypothetical protein
MDDYDGPVGEYPEIHIPFDDGGYPWRVNTVGWLVPTDETFVAYRGFQF